MSASHWLTTSHAVIERTLKALPAWATLEECEKALVDAYPFGERAMWPYKKWCEAKADALRKRFPTGKYANRLRAKNDAEAAAFDPQQKQLFGG